MLRVACGLGLGAMLAACSSGGGGGSGGQATTTGSGAGGSATTSGSGGATTTTSGSGGSTTTTTSSGTGGTGGEMIGAGPYFISYTSPGPGIDSRPSVTAAFAGEELLGYVASPMESPTRGTNVSSEVGMDAFIAWGRWNGGTTAGTFYSNPGVVLSATQGWHLVLGTATPSASVPASGGASYTLLGATHSTIDDGSFAIGTLTGSMNVAFSGATTRVGVDLSIDMPGDATYAVVSAGGTSTPSTSELGSLSAANAARLGGQVAVTSAGKACSGSAGCKASFQGFIAGPDADRIGLAFVLTAGMAGTQVRGVAVFQRQ